MLTIPYTRRMARLRDDDIQTVRAHADITTVVEAHVTLRRTGATLKGLCPFHDEKTPSFIVTPATNTWHCFGCSEGGDVIDFTQKVLHLDFRDAVTHLAPLAGVTITENDDDDDTTRAHRRRLFDANEAAATFYATALGTEEAAPAREFLTSRGFDPRATADHDGAGYAPNGGRALHHHLTSLGFTHQEQTDAGLIRDTRNGNFDSFQGRLTWAIRDTFGKCVGFGARRLYDNDRREAKFVNTGTTPIYNKSAVLFGIDIARKAIADAGHALVVEGYTDVVACRRAGIPNTVATCGTAFTRDHAQTLRRLVGDRGEITFGFDPDTAGASATMKTFALMQNEITRISVLAISKTGDPAEVWVASGADGIWDLVTHREPLLERVVISTLEGLPKATVEDRISAFDAVAPHLHQVKDPLLKEAYLHTVGERLGFDPAQLKRRLSSPGRPITNTPPPGEPHHDHEPMSDVERECLTLLTTDHAAAVEWASLIHNKFRHPHSRAVITLIVDQAPLFTGDGWPSHLVAAAAPDVRPWVTAALTTTTSGDTHDTSHTDDICTRLYQEWMVSEAARLRTALASCAPAERPRILNDILRIQEQLPPGTPMA